VTFLGLQGSGKDQTRVSLPTNRLQVKCKFCYKACWGGIGRMKHHLLGTKNSYSLS